MYTNYLKSTKERDTGVRLSVTFAAVVANGTKDLRRVFDRVCPLMSTPPFALISLSSQVWTNGRQWKGLSYALTRFIRRYCAAINRKVSCVSAAQMGFTFTALSWQ